MWKSIADEKDDALPFTQQLAILFFSVFYFIRWFVEPMSPKDWLIQLGAFTLFLLAYFIGFNVRGLTLASAIVMVVLSFFIAPYNYGANTFAIYACSFFAYYQPPRRALLFIALTLMTVLLTTVVHQLHMLFYFGISAVMIFGLGFSGIIDRQRLQHQRREQHSQNEIRRLAKIAERERIGQDLHDVIGHSLTGIHLKAQLALKRLEQDDHLAAQEQCLAVAQLAQSALKEIRATLADIKKQDLASELKAQQQFLESVGIAFQYQLPQKQLLPALESDLLLITRELITNTLRHAQATMARLSLTCDDSMLQMSYRDDGKGMISTDERDYGNGLHGIRQRVLQRRGNVRIYSDNGLQIALSMPWSSANNEHLSR